MKEGKEYIERATALKIIDNYVRTIDNNGKIVADAIRDIIQIICPSADVIEVVRCDDCIHRYENEESEYVCGLFDFPCGDDDFCNYGERRGHK